MHRDSIRVKGGYLTFFQLVITERSPSLGLGRRVQDVVLGHFHLSDYGLEAQSSPTDEPLRIHPEDEHSRAERGPQWQEGIARSAVLAFAKVHN